MDYTDTRCLSYKDIKLDPLIFIQNLQEKQKF